MASEQPVVTAGSGGSPGRDVLTRVIAVALVFVIVVASFVFVVLPLFGPSSGSSTSTSAPSGGLNAPPALCTDFTPAQELVNAKVANASAAGFPGYDEQLWLGFEQNFSSSVSYNVTLRAQNDSLGFGPVYLLNGVTDAGYWYQVGVGWNFASGEGVQYHLGFTFLYEVWSTSTSSPVFPAIGGTTPEGFFAQDGDVVLLDLNLTLSGQISMTAFDWNTSAKSTASYGAFGASQFLGFKDKTSGFPTSLMTEWYHSLPYFCSDEPAVYSNDAVALSGAWLRIDEWNLTGVSTSQRFNSSDTGQCCIFSTGYRGVSFQDPAAFQSLSTNGTTIYANAHEFVSP
jgi:hypothetical protein